jgi:hypothetical protein
VPELCDQDVIARREVDVVARVAAARRAHSLGVERIFEREDDAIHRHLLEVGMASIRRIELGHALQRVGQPAKCIADRGAPGAGGPRTGAGRNRPGR